MNLHIYLQYLAYWTPSVVVVDCLQHSKPRGSSKHFPLERVLHI